MPISLTNAICPIRNRGLSRITIAIRAADIGLSHARRILRLRTTKRRAAHAVARKCKEEQHIAMPKNYEVSGPAFIGLLVRDVATSAAFYENTLGFRRDPEVFPTPAVGFLTYPIPFAV